MTTSTCTDHADTSMRLSPKIPAMWDDLTPDQRAVYADLVSTINRPIVEVDALYDSIPDSFDGRVIGTDAGRELCKEYRDSWDGRLLYAWVTSGPASAYAQDRFKRALQSSSNNNSGKRRVLVMTAGGPASGKTSVIRSGLVDGSVDLVMDQNLGKHHRAIEQIDMAISHGWDVRIVYVFKPFDTIATEVIDRAHHLGRWSSINVVGHAHRTAQASMLLLYDKYANSDDPHPNVTVELKLNLHSRENPVPVTDMDIEDIRPGGKYYICDNVEDMDTEICTAMKRAKETGEIDPRLMAAMEFGCNPAKATSVGAVGAPPVYIMSRYHPSTKLTDSELTPAGVLKLSSGDCRDLIEAPNSDIAKQLLDKIRAAPCCKVTWGTTISRRLERISDVVEKHPQLKNMYCATPFEEAHATAISCRVLEEVHNAMVLIAFGGSCLHILTVNQDGCNNLLPGSNAASEGLCRDFSELIVDESELVGIEEHWLPGHTPPLPPNGTFYTTLPLDNDLDKNQFIVLVRLFKKLNMLLINAKGSYLVCGAPTNINPNNFEWWPDHLPRAIQTTFYELARHSALPQVKDNGTGLNTGGLLSDRHKITVGNRDTTVHEMVLSTMAAPHLVIDGCPSLSLPGVSLAMDYFE